MISQDKNTAEASGKQDERRVRYRTDGPVCRRDWLASRNLGIHFSRWIRAVAGRPLGRLSGACEPSARRSRSFDGEGTYVPRIRVLEPRIVLNATAELSALAGLTIDGDGADDFVHVESLNGGTEIQLRDGLGEIIPIAGHTGGVNGLETDPLAVSDISGGLLEVDLGGGNDQLVVDLPDGINLTVLDGAGSDFVRLDVQPSAATAPPTTLDVAADVIDFSASGETVELGNREVSLSGQVVFGDASISSSTLVDLGAGALTIDGSMQLNTSTSVVGTGALVDLSGATILASDVEIDLSFDLGSGSGSSLLVGTIGSNATEKLNDLNVNSVDTATFQNEIDLEGQLSVNADGEVVVQNRVSAVAVEISGGEIQLQGDVASSGGGISIDAVDSLTLEGDLATEVSGAAGDVDLRATWIDFDSTFISTAGGDVQIEADAQVDGTMRIETGVEGPVGGNVDWTGSLVSTAGGVGRLIIDATSAGDSGDVALGDLGGGATVSPQDLDAVTVNAGSLAVGDAGVTGGNIELIAELIRLEGERLRSSVAASNGGNIHIGGNVEFGSSSIDVVADVGLMITGDGVSDSPLSDVSLVGIQSVDVGGTLSGGNRLSIITAGLLELDGDVRQWQTVSLSGDSGVSLRGTELTAASLVEFNGHVSFRESIAVSADSIRFDQGVSVAAGRQVSLVGDAQFGQFGVSETVVDVGAGDLVIDGRLTLEGSLRFVGTGGSVDLASATTSAAVGGFDLQFEFDPTAGSAVTIGQVDASAGASLANLRVLSATDVAFLGSLEIDGELTARLDQDVRADRTLTASAVDLSGREIHLGGAVEATSGEIRIQGADLVSVNADLTTMQAGASGAVTIESAAVVLADSGLTTSGASVSVSGPLQLSGTVSIDSSVGAAVGGDILMVGGIRSESATSAGRLDVNAVGTSAGGTVRVDGAIGGSLSGDPDDLAGVTFAAGAIFLSNVGVSGGPVDLEATSIRVAGNSIRSSGAGGKIRIEGDTTFEAGSVVIDSETSLEMRGESQLQSSEGDLTIRSGGTASLEGRLLGGDQLEIDSEGELHLDADLAGWRTIELAGALGIDVGASLLSSIESISVSDSMLIENDLVITSEAIRFEDDVALQSTQDVLLQGNVRVGDVGRTMLLDLSSGSLSVDGSLTLADSLDVVGDAAFFDLSSSVTSATSGGADLTVRLGDASGSRVEFDRIDGSAGQRLANLQVVSATDVSFGSVVDVDGSLLVDATGNVRLQGPVSAAEVAIGGNEAWVLADVETTLGRVALEGRSELILSGDVVTTAAGTGGQIGLSGGSILLVEPSLVTAGADVVIDGPVTLDGTLEIDTAMGASTGGSVTFTGTVQSVSMGEQGRLTIQTVGSDSAGKVVLAGAVGGVSPGAAEDLASVQIDGGEITVSDIGVTGGSIGLQGTGIVSTGTTLRAGGVGGDIRLIGGVRFEGAVTFIDASSTLLLEGGGQAGSDANDVFLASGTAMTLRGELSGGNRLEIAAGTVLEVENDLVDWQSIDLSASAGMTVTSSRIAAAGTVVVQDQIVFSESAVVESLQARFDSSVNVQVSKTVDLRTSLIDSVGQSLLAKLGGGELILSGQNVASTDLSVVAGTLRLDGSTSGDSVIEVQSDGLLSGSGDAGGQVVIRGGSISPNEFQPDGQTGLLTVGALRFEDGSDYRVEIEGDVPGESYDSVSITDGPVDLTNAVLDLLVGISLPGDTELVIVDNATANDVMGRFLASFDEDGNVLATPRVLADGDLVLREFGPDGSAVEAYITYYGGDGNDVTIVTAGDTVQSVGNVILVERSGVNLQVRSGDTLADAQAADPTIRPLAGLAGNDVILNPVAPGAELYIDVDGFSGTGPGSLQFESDFVFDAASVGGGASVFLFDSDLSTPDSPHRLGVTYGNADDLTVQVDHLDGISPDYDLVLTGTSQVDLQLSSQELEILLTDFDDEVVVEADLNPRYSLLGIETNGQAGQLRFQHPEVRLDLDARGGNDLMRFDSFGADFGSVASVLGGEGTDQLIWHADVSMGNAAVDLDARLDAESISIDGDLSLVSGGDVIVDAQDALTVASVIDSQAGAIIIRSDASESDLGQSDLRSDFDGDAIVLSGGDFLLGRITASLGSLELGDPVTGTIGSVAQASGTEIAVRAVEGESRGSVFLQSVGNRIQTVDLKAASDVSLMDGESGLRVDVESGGSVATQTVGELLVGSVAAVGNVQLTAGSNLDGVPGQTLTHVSGQRVELIAGAVYPGQNPTPGVSFIGSSSGPVRVQADQEFSASTSGTNGSIFVLSPGGPGSALGEGELLVGLVDAGEGVIELTAYSINDVGTDPAADLIADEVFLQAQSGIGGERTIGIDGVSDVHASTTAGSVGLDLFSSRDVTLQQVSSGGGTGSFVELEHQGLGQLKVAQVANADGDVRITSQQTGIEVLPIGSGSNVFAGGTGDLLLRTEGDSADILVAGKLLSGSGSVSIHAQRDVVLASSSAVESLDGEVRLLAGRQASLVDSQIIQNDGSRIDAGMGSVTMVAPGNIRLSNVASAASGEAILIQSSTGSLIDSGDGDIDIDADQGTVRIEVDGGIGDGNALETRLGRLFAEVRGKGAIGILEASAIELADVRTFDGAIQISSDGSMTAERVLSSNSSGQDGTDHRDILLRTTGADADIRVGTIEALGPTDVSLVSGDDLLRIGPESLVRADDLAVQSFNATGDGDDSVSLRTAINDLELSVEGVARGDVQIDELDSLNLAASDRGDDAEQVRTSNGEIRINANQSIFISDSGLVDDGNGLLGDVEVVAGGDNGRIRLSAGVSFEVDDAVQMNASQTSAGAVSIETQEVILGKDFQIQTGGGVGVARQFALRPEEGLSGTAFYDATSVATTTLEQAVGNGARGVLTVDVGNSGERGLTLILDWGAPTARFQQIDGISGDAPPLEVSHVYTESDIVSSTLNGRGSSTDPLEVRFAVRHHESIVMTGQSISQAGSVAADVPGGLLSSTDNPFTQNPPGVPALENGEAEFLIPSLNVPVYFVPVRDVIPVFEATPNVVTEQQTFTTIDAGFESVPSVGSTTGTRDEYFQIRVLSPDPEEQDLVPPIRLPDNIISGDKLKELFESLPDGRYDIQYVFGDGNVRSILSVDLRDGKPVLPGDNLDGGTLRLRPIEPREIPADSDEGGDGEMPSDPDQVQYEGELKRRDSGAGFPAMEAPGAPGPGQIRWVVAAGIDLPSDSPSSQDVSVAQGDAGFHQSESWSGDAAEGEFERREHEGSRGEEVRYGRLSPAGRLLNRGMKLGQANDPLGEVD